MSPDRRPRVALLALCLAALPAQAGVELTLYDGFTASGDLTGSQGATVGWGFSLYNGTLDWLWAEATTYVPASGYADLGTYLDRYGPLAEPLAPAGSVTLYYPTSGLGAYQIDAVAVGSVTRGAIELTYSLFDADPFTDPDPGIIASGLTVTADASVTVVPLPATPLCLALGLLPLALARRPFTASLRGPG